MSCSCFGKRPQDAQQHNLLCVQRGVGGLPPTSNLPIFAEAKNRQIGIMGPMMHCLPLLSTISDNYHEFDPIQRKSRAVRLAADSLNAIYDTLNTIARR